MLRRKRERDEAMGLEGREDRGRGSSEGIVGLDPPPEWRRGRKEGTTGWSKWILHHSSNRFCYNKRMCKPKLPKQC